MRPSMGPVDYAVYSTPGAVGGSDVAVAVVGLVVSIMMALAILALLGAGKAMETLGVLTPVTDPAAPADSTAPADSVDSVDAVDADGGPEASPTVAPEASSEASPERVSALVVSPSGGPGLPASRLSPLNPVSPVRPVPGESGHWVRPAAEGGAFSPWSGTREVSGRLVELEQLAELYAVIPRGWLN